MANHSLEQIAQSQRVSRVLGDRYDRVVDRTVLRADDAFDEAIDRVRATAAQTLNDDHLRRLNNVLDQDVLSQVRPDDTIPGEAFKRIETTLRQQADKASRPNSSLQDDDYVDVLNATRDVFRDIIARQNPDAAAEIAALNRGWAINARIRRAVSGGAQMARDGTPTPGELTNTVVQMSSEGQRAGERALLQGLASDARAVLPATVGDTGSGQRAVMGGVIGGVATGAIGMVNPTIATAIATGALVYSRPGIAALNAVYRATDGLSAQPALRQLAELARRDPALVPYYEAALQHVLGRESQGTAAAPQAVSAQQQASPALARVLQQ